MAITLIAGLSNLLGVTRGLLPSPKTSIGELFLDASHIENVKYSNTITMQPVQDGSDISDHVYLNPIEIKISGSMCDSAIDLLGAANSFIGSLTPSGLTNIVTGEKGMSSKQATAFQILTNMRDTKKLVTVVNYFDTYDNMEILDLVFPRDNKTGDRLYFEITLRQITFATVKTVNISTRPQSFQDMVSKKVDLGSQTTLEPTTEEVTKAKRSILDNILF